MEGYQSENEQLESLKNWWKAYGKHIIAGVVLGIGVIGGVQVWRGQQEANRTAASIEYQQLLEMLEKNNPDRVLAHGQRLLGEYENTPYAALGALAMAKIKFDKGDTAAARTHLQWVISHPSPLGLEHVARLRLARLLVLESKHQEALTTLTAVTDTGGYAAAYEEAKGDILRVLDRPAEARTAYSKAKTALSTQPRGEAVTGADQERLQMKLDDLGNPKSS